jgi:putative PIN family toxin of toxin-antitoxin system
MTVVIDCNIFVMCITSRSPYHFIYQALIKGKFKLAVTTDILLEYEEILQQKYSVATAHAFITLLNELPNVQHINSHYHWQLITADPEDNKYCDCAIAGQADHIVTEDRHFDILKNTPFPSINVISIDNFLAAIQLT